MGIRIQFLLFKIKCSSHLDLNIFVGAKFKGLCEVTRVILPILSDIGWVVRRLRFSFGPNWFLLCTAFSNAIRRSWRRRFFGFGRCQFFPARNVLVFVISVLGMAVACELHIVLFYYLHVLASAFGHWWPTILCGVCWLSDPCILICIALSEIFNADRRYDRHVKVALAFWRGTGTPAGAPIEASALGIVAQR